MTRATMTSAKSIFARATAAWQGPAASGLVWPAAFGVSITIHAGLLVASAFVPLGFGMAATPAIQMPRGEQAVRVRILAHRWPEPVDDRREKEPGPQLEADSAEPDPGSGPAPGGPARMPPEAPVPARRPAQAEPRGRIDEPIESPARSGASAKAARVDPLVHEPEARPAPDDGPDTAEPATPTFEAGPTREAGHVNVPPAAEREAGPRPTSDSSPQPDAESKRAPAPPREVPERDTRRGVDTGVQIRDLPAPEYPRLSRRLGEEGTVLLSVEVLASGKAGRVEVLEASRYPRLNEAAIAAARRARFRPATRGGRAVAGNVRLPFRFVLE